MLVTHCLDAKHRLHNNRTQTITSTLGIKEWGINRELRQVEKAVRSVSALHKQSLFLQFASCTSSLSVCLTPRFLLASCAFSPYPQPATSRTAQEEARGPTQTQKCDRCSIKLLKMLLIKCFVMYCIVYAAIGYVRSCSFTTAG